LRARAAEEGAPSNDGDHPFAVARRGRHEVEAGGADEAGFHSVGAGIAADQRVVVALDHLAHADARKVPIVVVFRKFLDGGAGEDRMSRADVICSSAGSPFGLTKCDCVMPSRCALRFHLVGEVFDRAADASAITTAMSFADFTISILSALSTVTVGAGGEAHLDRRLRRRVVRDQQQLVERDPTFLDGAQRHIGGHDFRDRGRIPRIGGVLGVQHLPAVASIRIKASAPAGDSESAMAAQAAKARISVRVGADCRENIRDRGPVVGVGPQKHAVSQAEWSAI